MLVNHNTAVLFHVMFFFFVLYNEPNFICPYSFTTNMLEITVLPHLFYSKFQTGTGEKLPLHILWHDAAHSQTLNDEGNVEKTITTKFHSPQLIKAGVSLIIILFISKKASRKWQVSFTGRI